MDEQINSGAMLYFIYSAVYMVLMAILISKRNELLLQLAKYKRLRALDKMDYTDFFNQKKKITSKINRIKWQIFISLGFVILLHTVTSYFTGDLTLSYFWTVLVLCSVFIALSVIALLLKGTGVIDHKQRLPEGPWIR